ncbi:glycosyltransferase family 4 protein [Phenylobacterium montanum]|uniref:Glycosyltransferase family 4 protein n=1 Tax=Phenylobacterium montanum TaxID=2823693 RepID=A0A975FYX6_9CAUL|nr:glycosyltransferase family 4 protein [Caulobacter sp. S6]QUD87487.1 glycosyltransferase family 4 protein [Caulobacter sp. S6]
MSRLPADFTLLQVTPELETGGAEQTTLDVAAAVVRAGGRAIVASRGGRMTDALFDNGGQLVELPMQSKNPLTILGNALRLGELIRREKVSLVHARSRAPAFSALWAAKAANVPFVATYHGVYEARSPLKRWYNSVMTQGAAVIANSDYTRQHILAEHRVDPARVVAINRGVDLVRFDPKAVTPTRLAALRASFGVAEDDRRFKIVLAGRLTRWKGQQLLIDAAQRLKAKGLSDFLIILAGDDQGRIGYRGELETAIAAAGLGEQVLLVGHCSDMPAAYLLADLVVAPSLKPEPFGRTAVEPQAMGRPVLAADHGAVRETVAEGETGWRVAPGDPDAWAEAIAKVMALTPARRAAIGNAGAARARKLYSVEAMCEATLNLYANVLAKGTP